MFEHLEYMEHKGKTWFGQVAYMMVTSVCSSKECTHLTPSSSQGNLKTQNIPNEAGKWLKSDSFSK